MDLDAKKKSGMFRGLPFMIGADPNENPDLMNLNVLS